MINKYNILDWAKCFYSGILQNYFVFLSAKKTLNILVTLIECTCGNIKECQKKILKV